MRNTVQKIITCRRDSLDSLKAGGREPKPWPKSGLGGVLVWAIGFAVTYFIKQPLVLVSIVCWGRHESPRHGDLETNVGRGVIILCSKLVRMGIIVTNPPNVIF
jgi:hypothetical protein